MTTLSIPLHIPVLQLDNLLRAELSHREVLSVKVDQQRNLMVIEHDRKPPENSIWL
jgi:hypothetical protein